MDDMEEKLGAILANPDMMKTIMSMAQTLGQSESKAEQPAQDPPPQKQSAPQSKPAPPPKAVPALGRNELEMISKISALSQQTGLDRQEQALLKALNPYLSHDRLGKLEKAMHAAKLARFASYALDQSSRPQKIGR